MKYFLNNFCYLLDSQYVNSEPDDELINSENENAHSSDGFQKDVDFGKDKIL